MSKVMYFKIPATNLQKSKAFYETVFKWQLSDDVQMPDGVYNLATTTESDDMQVPKEKSAINGAIMQRSDAVTAPTIVIDVPSIDDCLKSIENAGGRVVKPKEVIPGNGAYAYVADVDGNVLGVWQNLSNVKI